MVSDPESGLCAGSKWVIEEDTAERRARMRSGIRALLPYFRKLEPTQKLCGVCILMSLALPAVSKPVKPAANPQVQEIRAQYGAIESGLPTFKRDFVEVNEGCAYTIELYRQGDSVMKISCVNDVCDMADGREDYYFKNGRLCFAFLKDVTALQPNRNTGSVAGWRVREDRVYVVEGRIIQHLVKRKDIEDGQSQDLSAMANTAVSDSENAERIEGQIKDHLGWFRDLFRGKVDLQIKGLE